MLSGTLLSDHLTAEEISSLSQHDRTLVRAVKLILPPREEGSRGQQRPTDVESLYDGLVGFECSYCSSTPVMEVIPSKRRALFKEVFPGSIESMGAALHLLRDKHFSFEATQFQQRCLYLPASERRIFDQKDYQVFSQSQALSLQMCCERFARRIGLTNKEASREKSGIVINAEPQQKPTLSTKSADKKRGRDELVGRQKSCNEMLPKRKHYSDDSETFPYSLGEIGNISSLPQTSQALSPLQEYSSRSRGLSGLQSLSQGKADATQPSAMTQIAPPPVSPYVAPFYARNSGRSHEEAEGSFAGLRGRTISNISHVSPGGLARKRYPISPMSHATITSRQASPLSFIHDGLGWTCPHCLHIPFSLRASGSFHQREPSREEAYNHFRKCQGLQQRPMQSP